MVKPIENIELKLQALEEAISYPKYKEEKDTCMIEVPSFSYDIISEKIQNNEKLTNLEGAKIDLILEIVKLMSDNKIKYNVELHNYIGFYWRGLLIVTIKINSDQQELQLVNSRMMYVSVKVYKDELQTAMTDRKISRVLAGTIGGLLVIAGAIFAYSVLRKKDSA